MKIILLIAFFGHVLCGICDCLLSYNGKQRIDFKCIKEQVKMAEAFKGMPLLNPLLSVLLGVPAIVMFGFGYFALSNWIGTYSQVIMLIMSISTVFYIVFGAVHHVIFSLIEWFYVRMGRTGEARETVLELEKKTISTMFFCYAGLAAFLITLIVAILSGTVPLPKWACLFNTLPIMLLLAPTKLPAKGNIAGAVMFLGLFFVI